MLRLTHLSADGWGYLVWLWSFNKLTWKWYWHPVEWSEDMLNRALSVWIMITQVRFVLCYKTIEELLDILGRSWQCSNQFNFVTLRSENLTFFFFLNFYIENPLGTSVSSLSEWWFINDMNCCLSFLHFVNDLMHSHCQKFLGGLRCISNFVHLPSYGHWSAEKLVETCTDCLFWWLAVYPNEFKFIQAITV